MRIIGGEYRSRIISMPKGVLIRPTQDKVRQAVFNMIGDCCGKRALDLFAGSGAFGIEAISRGAKHATFVERNAVCIKTIKANIDSLGINPCNYIIINDNSMHALSGMEKTNEKYDIIFLDPPYHRDMGRICLINIDACGILTPNGLVVTEHSVRDSLAANLKHLAVIREKRYGDTAISIFGRA